MNNYHKLADEIKNKDRSTIFIIRDGIAWVYYGYTNWPSACVLMIGEVNY